MRARALISLLLASMALVGAARSTEAFEAELRTTAVAGTTIGWYERGSGPPLLMLTGTGSTLAEWDPALLRLLAADHRLILIDYPGVGRSGPWRGRDFDSLAAVTARFMGAIGVDRAAVLGWSMGGFVAQRLAVEHPGRVGRLILAGTNPGGPQAVLGPPWVQKVDSDPDPSTAAILRELYPPAQRAEGRRFLARLARASSSGEIPDDFSVPAATVKRQVAAEDPWLRSARNFRQLGKLKVPTLVLGGRADAVVPPLNSRRIASRIPNARLRLLPGAHAFLFQSRRQVARLLSADGGG